MKRMLCVLAIFTAMAGGRASAHRSYGPYDRDRFVEIEGIPEARWTRSTLM
jgi:hypothetical protein